MTELVTDGELKPKTVNNARTCLSMALGEAVRRRYLHAGTRAGCVPELPVDRIEIDYLRLGRGRALPRRLRRPLPSARGVADRHRCTHLRGGREIQGPDVDLDAGAVRISRQLARSGIEHERRQGKRFRSVQIGPRLVHDAQTHSMTTTIARAQPTEVGSFFALRNSAAATPAAPSRCRRIAGQSTTGTSGALKDAGIRDMPLHSLRHTAATALARHPTPADLRPAPTRPPLDHHHRGTLRAPRAFVRPTGGRADRGADRFLLRGPRDGRARGVISQADRRRARPAATAGSPTRSHVFGPVGGSPGSHSRRAFSSQRSMSARKNLTGPS